MCGFWGAGQFSPVMNQSGLTFYFLNIGGAETATFTWILNNGDANGASSTADFNILGLSGNLLPSAFAQSGLTGTSLSNAQAQAALMQMTNSPIKGGVGVYFDDIALPVSDAAQCPGNVGGPPAQGCGQFIWVQILNSVTQSILLPPSDDTQPANDSNQLDGTYPYAFGGPPFATWDSPSMGLLWDWGMGAEQFSATMYVLWDPALPAGCTPAWTDTATQPQYTPHASTCISSIPIPLGSVKWGWSACSINEMAAAVGGGTMPSWFLQCGVGSGNSAGSANGYPQWVPGTGPGGCATSGIANCQ
jgi:hypothetical protein